MTPLIAHLIGDYVLQTDHMAARKTEAHGPAAAHALSYALPFAAMTRRWQALTVIAGTHFVVDRYGLARHVTWARNHIAPQEWRAAHDPAGSSDERPEWLSGVVLILVDNTLHGVINGWALRRWPCDDHRALSQR